MPAPTGARVRTLAALATLALLVPACRDEGPRQAASATLDGPTTRHLLVGQEVELELRCLDSDGRALPLHPVNWRAVLPQLADVRPAGHTARVRALHVGTTVVYGVCRKRPIDWFELEFGTFFLDPTVAGTRIVVDSAPATLWEIDFEGDTIDLRTPTPVDSTTGVTRLLSVRGRTVTGEILAPNRFTWTSAAPTIATVSSTGVVTAVSEGITALTVIGLGAERAVFVRVLADARRALWDIALVDAHWTQGVQDERQSVPIFREGRAAVVNVLAFATADAPAARVFLRVQNASGSLIWLESVALVPTVGALPSFATPSAQFLVPRAVVNSAATWRVERDTLASGADALGANDRLPRSGNEPLRTVTPPVLKLHLVPLRLTKNGNIVSPVNASTAVFYDSIARIRLPLGRVEITIGAPQATGADFLTEGGTTTAGDWPFFTRVLEEIDAARVAHPTLSSSIWIGVIPRPAGATSRWGGQAYLPSTPTLSGPLTRSQVVQGHDWFASPVSAGFTVAHELGHNFGRLHAPCGSPSGVDEFYPVAGGRVGRWLHWTSRWEHGTATFASTIADTLSDVMSYCGHYWVSAYTFLGIMNFRQLDGAVLRAPEERRRSLVVRGVVVDGVIRLSQPRIDDVVPTGSDVESPVRVELLDASGRVLITRNAVVGRTGDSETGLSFALHVALDEALQRNVRRIRARAGGALAEIEFSAP